MSNSKNRILHSRVLEPFALEPFPLGSITPLGWLENQLNMQAHGLSGHLHEFWPRIKDSEWIGGTHRFGWESVPYWLDGIIPLAFLLAHDGLKAVIRRWIDYILGHQDEDGWLGPRSGEGNWPECDPWIQFPLLKALIQYEEATGDVRIIPALMKVLRKLDTLLDDPKQASVAGRERWADLVLSVHHLYELRNEQWLLDLTEKARRWGYDWREHFADFRFKSKMCKDDIRATAHVVNNAMAIKQPAVWYRQSGDREDLESVYHILKMLDTYHGQVTGLFSGDEHYAGRNPSQGTELCAVVEYMFSLEKLITITGNPVLADRLERIAFNALPSTFKPDMWAHQYDQQANQVICRISEDRIYVDNGPDANIFGLEPNCRCCTGNMHQGWPKLTTHLWMGTPEGGVAAVAYAPNRLQSRIAGSTVSIELDTKYPFDDVLRFCVRTDEPTEFPFLLRIPAWAAQASVEVEGLSPCNVRSGSFHRIDRRWDGETAVTLRLPAEVRVQRRYRNSVSIERGPLVYSLLVNEEWKRINTHETGKELPHGDWEVYPTSAWNYALELDTDHPHRSVQFEPRPLGDCPFSAEGTPVKATVKGRKIPSWRIEHNAAGSLPESPVLSDELPEKLTLIPYGCTNLRVTEFPLLASKHQSNQL